MKNQSEQRTYLSEDPSTFLHFNLNVEVVTCFIEHENTILVLKRSPQEDQPFTWAVPGGKIEPSIDTNAHSALLRELLEEIGLQPNPDNLILRAVRYGRIAKWDYKLYVFHLQLTSKPPISLSEEHIEAMWIPIHQFTSLTLLKGQNETFAALYG
jgi:8-oxo-dGTP pyrophosphatase MutT (NUDIX family)